MVKSLSARERKHAFLFYLYSEFGLRRHKDSETSVHIAIFYVFMCNWIIEKEMGDIF